MNIAQPIIKIVVSAPQRGKLRLSFNFFDGTVGSMATTPSAIRQVMREHDCTVSVEQLAAVAFCGHRCVLVLDENPRLIFEAQASPFELLRDTQRRWFALGSMILETCEREISEGRAVCSPGRRA
jgi:hypothetical protein